MFRFSWAKRGSSFRGDSTTQAENYQTKLSRADILSELNGKPALASKTLLACHCSHHRMENLHSISTAKLWFGRALGMRHHADHVAASVADAGDVFQRTVGIRRG